ncbi:MAG: SDR family oxidoreductase [Deltaproteobacteria bacterium]|nr:SDR family oxidoreductase [Deltaproteobacteria bacterium]
MKKTALVTGGAGFLGSHLCDALLRQGKSVLCLDDLSTGRMENIAHLAPESSFEFIRRDVTEPLGLGQFDIAEIYSLACPASPVHYQHNPVKTIRTNFIGTAQVLELATKINAKVLLASTSEVYGNPLCHPQREEYWGNVNPIGIRGCYDEGKRAAECLMMDYHRQKGLDIRIVRIFNTYGPRMAKNDGRVVSNFIVQALAGEDITIYGTGEQTRSFCFVSDLIAGILIAMESEQIGCLPVNIGNSAEERVLDLASTILRLTQSQAKIVFKPLPADDPQRRRPDISRAQTVLGWEPRIKLEQGLRETIKYFEEICLLRSDTT